MKRIAITAFALCLSIGIRADDNFNTLSPKQQQLANELVDISMNTFNIAKVFASSKEDIESIQNPKQKCLFTTLANHDNFYQFQKTKAITYIKNHSLKDLDKQLDIFSPTLTDYLKRSFEVGFQHGLESSNDLTEAKRLSNELKTNQDLATSFKTLTYSSDYLQIRHYLNYDVDSKNNVPFEDYMIWSYSKCKDLK